MNRYIRYIIGILLIQNGCYAAMGRFASQVRFALSRISPAFISQTTRQGEALERLRMEPKPIPTTFSRPYFSFNRDTAFPSTSQMMWNLYRTGSEKQVNPEVSQPVLATEDAARLVLAAFDESRPQGDPQREPENDPESELPPIAHEGPTPAPVVSEEEPVVEQPEEADEPVDSPSVVGATGSDQEPVQVHETDDSVIHQPEESLDQQAIKWPHKRKLPYSALLSSSQRKRTPAASRDLPNDFESVDPVLTEEPQSESSVAPKRIERDSGQPFQRHDGEQTHRPSHSYTPSPYDGSSNYEPMAAQRDTNSLDKMVRSTDHMQAAVMQPPVLTVTATTDCPIDCPISRLYPFSLPEPGACAFVDKKTTYVYRAIPRAPRIAVI